MRRTGPEVRCHPLAGTITLPPNVAPDDYETWLLGSTKNLHEHARRRSTRSCATLANVYDDIARGRRALDRGAAHRRAPRHLDLGSSRHRDEAPDALDVLRLLHPTAAVGGIPRESAYELHPPTGRARPGPLRRARSAGSTPTATASGGSGCAACSSTGRDFEAWAGAGIVERVGSHRRTRGDQRQAGHAVLSSVLVDRV